MKKALVIGGAVVGLFAAALSHQDGFMLIFSAVVGAIVGDVIADIAKD